MANKPGPKTAAGPTRPVSFRIDGDLLDAIDNHAASLRLSRNKVVELVLRQHVPPAPKKMKEKQLDLFS